MQNQPQEIDYSKKREIWTKSHSRKLSVWGDISLAMPENEVSAESGPLETGQQIEYILHWACSKYGEKTFKIAQEEFFLLSGKYFHDNLNYHQRINYFLDYFIFERKISDLTKAIDYEPPYYTLINSEEFALSELDREIIRDILDLRKSIHSLFVIKKVNIDYLIVEDLFTTDKRRISPMKGQAFIGMEKGQIFQSFLYSCKGKYLLSKGIIIHPRQAWSSILKQCKKFRKNKSFNKFIYLMKLAKIESESRTRKPNVTKLFYKNSLGT